MAIDGLDGVTAIDCSDAGVTISVSFGLVTPLSDAVITVVPTVNPLARPPGDDIVATDGVPDAHVTWLVTFCVVALSLYVRGSR